MNAILWVMGGGIVAALTFRLFDLNVSRGLVVSAIIGGVTAYFGGSVLAPLMGAATDTDFNPFALLVASSTALAALYFTDQIYERFGA